MQALAFPQEGPPGSQREASLYEGSAPPHANGRHRRPEVLEQILTASEDSSSMAGSADSVHARPVHWEDLPGGRTVMLTAEQAGPNSAMLSASHTANRMHENAADADASAAGYGQAGANGQSHKESHMAMSPSHQMWLPAAAQQVLQQLPEGQRPAHEASLGLVPGQPMTQTGQAGTCPAGSAFDAQHSSRHPAALTKMPAMFGSFRLPPLWIEVPEGFPAAGANGQAAGAIDAMTDQELRPPQQLVDACPPVSSPAAVGVDTAMPVIDPSQAAETTVSACISPTAVPSFQLQEGAPRDRQSNMQQMLDGALESANCEKRTLELTSTGTAGRSAYLQGASLQHGEHGPLPLQPIVETDQQPHLQTLGGCSDEHWAAHEPPTAQQALFKIQQEQQPLLQPSLSSDEHVWPILYEPTPSGSPTSQLQPGDAQASFPIPASDPPGAMSVPSAAPTDITAALAMAGANPTQIDGSGDHPSIGAAAALLTVRSELSLGDPSMRAAEEGLPAEPAIKLLVQRQLWRFPSEPELSEATASPDGLHVNSGSESTASFDHAETPGMQPVESVPKSAAPTQALQIPTVHGRHEASSAGQANQLLGGMTGQLSEMDLHRVLQSRSLAQQTQPLEIGSKSRKHSNIALNKLGKSQRAAAVDRSGAPSHAMNHGGHPGQENHYVPPLAGERQSTSGDDPSSRSSWTSGQEADGLLPSKAQAEPQGEPQLR